MEKKQIRVAVIGSGIGGLTSALHLAKAGCKVTIFERGDVCGGYAVAFKRKGFTFEVALHSVPCGSDRGHFYKLVQDCGIDDKINFVKIPLGPKVTFGENCHCLPSDEDDVFEYLQNRFPDEKKNIQKLQQKMGAYARCYSKILVDNKASVTSLLRFILRLPGFLTQSYESADHFLSRFVKNQEIKALLYQYAIFMGIPMDEFPAVNFIIMVYMLLSNGMYTIDGGGARLTDVLRDECIKNSVEIRLQTEITGIEVRNNTAVAVVDSKGKRFDTDYIVSNTSTYELVKMVNQKLIPSDYSRALNSLKPSISVALLSIGLDCPVVETGIDRHLHFHFPDSNLDTYLKTQRDELFVKGFSITASGLTSPDNNAQNEKILSITGAVSSEKWLRFGSDEYKQNKELFIMKALEALYRLYPKVKGHVVFTDLATPRTFFRYTGNPLGALMGFNCTIGTHSSIIKVSKFPIKNVLQTGAWTDKLGGFMQSMSAGVKAATVINKMIAHTK